MATTEDGSLYHIEREVKGYDSKAYRAWPIFLLSFMRLFYVSIFERAFLNYIYFYVNISENTLGFINSATSVAYIIGPIFGQFVTKKLGLRNSILISATSTPILIAAQMIYFEPLYLICIRVTSGLLLGVYWPNCYNMLSQWQSISDEKKANKNFKYFNFSWNLGFISGLLVGYLWAFSLNEYLTMIISWLLSFLLIPFSLFIKKDTGSKKLEELPKNLELIRKDEVIPLDLKFNPDKKSNNYMIVYPILFSWLALTSYTMSKSIIRFNYSVFLKAFSGPSYFTYLIQLSLQIGQLAGLTWSNSMKTYTRKISVFISLTMIILLSSAIIIFQNLTYITIISASAGLFIGLIQGTSLKIMIDYGSESGTKKFSTVNEVLKGIGFGLTPIAAGLVAEINMYAIFVILIIVISCILIALIYLSRNVKRTGEK